MAPQARTAVCTMAVALLPLALAGDAAAEIRAKMGHAQNLESIDTQLRTVKFAADKEKFDADTAFEKEMITIQHEKDDAVKQANRKFDILQKEREPLVQMAQEEMNKAKVKMETRIAEIKARPEKEKPPEQYDLTAPHQVTVIDSAATVWQNKNCAWCKTTKQLETKMEIKDATDAWELVQSNNMAIIEKTKADIQKAKDDRDKTIADANEKYLDAKARVTKTRDEATIKSAKKLKEAEAKHDADTQLATLNKVKADEDRSKVDEKLKKTTSALAQDAAIKAALDAAKSTETSKETTVALLAPSDEIHLESDAAKDEAQQQDEAVQALATESAKISSVTSTLLAASTRELHREDDSLSVNGTETNNAA